MNTAEAWQQRIQRKLASAALTSVLLPAGLAVSGEVLTGHVRSIDTLGRSVVYAGKVPAAILEDVRSKLATLIGL